MKKSISRIIGVIMLIVAFVFIMFALNHPEMSFPWNNTITWLLYGLYILVTVMAQQLLFFNTKVRILAQKRLRDRLKIYLQTLTPDEKGCYSLPYTRTELADFLCVDRSALSRELCRMRDERILDFSGAKIHLLNPTFLYGWN